MNTKRTNKGCVTDEFFEMEPSIKRRKTERLPNTTDDTDSDDSEIPCAQAPPLERTLASYDSPTKKQMVTPQKVYLNASKSFMKSYGKLLRLEDMFKRVLESNDSSSSESDLSDYSISSFEDPNSDEEPFKEVPAESLVLSTRVRRKDGSEEPIHCTSLSCDRCKKKQNGI